MYVHPLDRENMFKYSGVHCRANATKVKELICYECKLNNGKDLSIEDLSLADQVVHLEAHVAAGHITGKDYTLERLILEKNIEDRSVKSVTVHYVVSSGGDGSVSVRFADTAKAAEVFEDNMDEGWGEPSTRSETLHFDANGVLINADIFEGFEEED